MAITHLYDPPVADDGTSPVGVTEWEADHDHVPFEYTLFSDLSAQGFTNLGAGPTELGSNRGRSILDLTHVTEVRVIVTQAAVASSNSWLRIRGATDGSTFAYLNASGSGPTVTLSTSTNVVVDGSWIAVDAGMKAVIHVQVVAGGGDSAADPSIHRVTLQAR